MNKFVSKYRSKDEKPDNNDVLEMNAPLLIRPILTMSLIKKFDSLVISITL